MTYLFALTLSGIGWFIVAAALGSGVPILGEMWVQHLISAIVTSLAVGYMFRKPLITWRGLWWYMLPILTLLSATTLYGFLLPLSWSVTAAIKGSGNVDGQAFYQIPAMMVLYSMTVYIVVLYPLALLTQTALRNISRDA